jgi:type IV pilus assembly protein PilW
MSGPLPSCDQKGFTLVEILVALVVGVLVIAVIWEVYRVQRQVVVSQEQVTDLQQNLRVAVFQMKRDLRTAGFDPNGSNNFGLTFIGFQDIDGNPDADGNSAITFTADLNANRVLDENNEIISYRIYDQPADTGGDGFLDLGRRVGAVGPPGIQLVAENIAALGLAYAFDADGDGILDTYTSPGGDQVLFWGIDSTNDGFLDTHLDTNLDGEIDRADAPPGVVNGVIAGLDLNPPVPMDRIRAVRLWLLAEARNPDPSYYDNNTYVVGRRIISPQDNRRRRATETVFQCKNLGVD